MCSSMVKADFSTPARRGGGGTVFSSGSDIKNNSCLVSLCLWNYQGKGIGGSMDNQLREKGNMPPGVIQRRLFLSLCYLTHQGQFSAACVSVMFV
ncbi:conserved hypothetical protein [Xenorhabdus innexi]|uniref:Uncharacterized protein n=1 Tax=Xenorhabdus innexi TaxID=290109 RepID=A0A1N6N2B0_9GAMM|nr:conserved hypothetical protein [Xenorhabdus innexi]